MYFAKRYVDLNETAFTDVDTCHTLTCAIMLLNTDLHDPVKNTLIPIFNNLFTFVPIFLIFEENSQ